jgi:hypothetical protein
VPPGRAEQVMHMDDSQATQFLLDLGAIGLTALPHGGEPSGFNMFARDGMGAFDLVRVTHLF